MTAFVLHIWEKERGSNLLRFLLKMKSLHDVYPSYTHTPRIQGIRTLLLGDKVVSNAGIESFRHFLYQSIKDVAYRNDGTMNHTKKRQKYLYVLSIEECKLLHHYTAMVYGRLLLCPSSPLFDFFFRPLKRVPSIQIASQFFFSKLPQNLMIVLHPHPIFRVLRNMAKKR